MKIKTKDATDTQLDWLVAKCENFSGLDSRTTPEGVRWAGDFFRPTVKWSEGGPIIEREKLHVAWSPLWKEWVALKPSNAALGVLGPTPLVAAMRAYVASKLGDEVEIPEELA